MKNVYLFAIFAIFFIKNANGNYFNNGIEYDDISAIVFETDKDGNVLKTTIKKNEILFTLEQNIILSEFEKIPTWEQAQLNSQFEVPLPSYIGEKSSQITYSAALRGNSDFEKYFFAGFFSVSSFAREKEYQFTILESIGGELKRRFEYFTNKKVQFYIGSKGQYIKNYVGEVNGVNLFQNASQWDFFLSAHIKLHNYIPRSFLKVDTGFRWIDIKELGAEGFLGFFFNTPFNEEIMLSMEGEVALDPYKVNNNFWRYASVYGKLGASFATSKATNLSMFLAYEHNVWYGYKKQEIGFRVELFF